MSERALCLCADRDRRTGGHNTNYYTGSSSKKKKNYMVVGRRRRKYENKHVKRNVLIFGLRKMQWHSVVIPFLPSSIFK